MVQPAFVHIEAAMTTQLACLGDVLRKGGCRLVGLRDDVRVAVGEASGGTIGKDEAIAACIDRHRLAVRGRRRTLIGDERGAMGAPELEAGRIAGRDECRELAGLGVDCSEGIADRGEVIVGVEVRGVNREDAVVRGVRDIERSCVRIDFENVVEPGLSRHPLHLGEGDRLMRGPGIVHVDDDLIAAAGQQQVAIRRELE